MKPRHVIATALALAAAASAALPASAYPRPGRTEQVSVSPSGLPAEGSMVVYPSISANGRYVVFVSDAANLVPTDESPGEDAFIYDRRTGRTEIASIGHDGTQAMGGSKIATVSEDGRFVAFNAIDRLVPGDTNDELDIYVRDRELGVTERVSVRSDGGQANGYAGLHGISGDGRHVVFESPATNIVSGDTNASPDIFVRDREAGVTRRVSVTSGGAQANGRSHSPSISSNGRFVVFASYASNLVANDTNGYQDTFIHDLETGATEMVSVGHDGGLGSDYSSMGTADDSGRFVVFESWAPNLIPADTPRSIDVFVRDRVEGTTERISVPTEGAQPNGSSEFPMIGADGRFVAFISGASNLVPGDTNGVADMFVRDLVTGVTERVSVADGGQQGNAGVAWWPSISADGGAVAFVSTAANLGEGGEQLYVRDRGPVVGVGGIDLYEKKPEVVVDGWATFSGNVLTAGSDTAGDGVTAAGDVGADLTGGRVAYQVEPENLAIRWDVAELPANEAVVGLPAVVYAASFRVGGARYEIRGSRVGATVVTPSAPGFALYRCDAACTQVRALGGSVGTAGRHATAVVPISSIGASDGSQITDLVLSTGFGEVATGPVSVIDQMSLTAAEIPARTVRFGVADERVPLEEVAFDIEAEHGNGTFAGFIDRSGRDPEIRERLWVRACLGEVCGTGGVDLPA